MNVIKYKWYKLNDQERTVENGKRMIKFLKNVERFSN